MENNELFALKKRRLKWVEANRENDFEEGINRFLTELYPDNAHFIYELLQNAEDPKANEVTFKLTQSAVEFSHNGQRLFELKDVESITSIGNSTKREDTTSIGKFGVGFKAVFAYTNTPEIHSGEYHFQIHDLVVPEFDNIPQLPLEENKTNFIFPFNNPKKSASLAVSEIEKGLRALGDNTLLFLSHIRKISYSLPDGSQGSLERIDHENGRIEIKTQHPNKEESTSNWLHFYKDVDVTEAEGKNKHCRIAIAYQLEQVIDKNKISKWKITRINDGGQVSIYFPAEKETSKLFFHIHAPFASTVARDSVRDCDENNQLRNHLADLIVESLSKIRDLSMLTVNFLSVLPILKDGLAPFYEPIRKAIILAFETESLTPTKNGHHAKSTMLYRGLAKMSDVINNEDLTTLTGKQHDGWVVNAQQKNSREDVFLDDLQIDKFEFDELFEIFESLDTAIGVLNADEDTKDFWEEEINSYKKIKTWFEQKDDKWIKIFYTLLSEDDENSWSLLDFPFVRLNTENGDKHTRGVEAYFEPLIQQDFENFENILTVKQSVYYKDKAKKNIDENAVSFLKSIGVREFDERVVIENKLKRYDSQNSINYPDSKYFDDIKLFISYWKRSPLEIGLFDRYLFLLGISTDNKLFLSKPDELYLDKPFVKTGLSEVQHIHRKIAVWGEYKNKLNKIELKDFVDFLRALEIMTELTVTEVGIGKNPKWINREFYSDIYAARHNNSTLIQDDYSIEKLDIYLNNQSIESSCLVWNALIRADKKHAKARYRPNAKYDIREEDSQLIYHLKNHAWIPNKNEEFCKPQDMSIETLHDEFKIINSLVFDFLLKAIGFGENIKKCSEEYKAKNKFAKDAGFDSIETMEKFAEIHKNGFNPDEIIRKQKKIELPEESVHNIERRTKGILERSENAPSKESIKRERSIQIGIQPNKAEAKAYLRAKYTNAQGEVGCQCCHQEMPFKINGEYYFEAVQCIKELKKHHPQNNLAFCPNCAAMYQYACEIDNSEIIRLIIDEEFDGDKNSFEIVIKLAGEHHTIRFVPTHFADLQVLLINES